MKIIFQRADGGTSILSPARKEDLAKTSPFVMDMTDEEYIAYIMDRDVPAEATHVRIVQDNEIPTDRSFRNAWKHDLTVDIDKAVDITKERLKVEGNAALDNLSKQYQLALARGTPTQGILNAMAQVDDIMKSPNNTMTLAQLKAIKVPQA